MYPRYPSTNTQGLPEGNSCGWLVLKDGRDFKTSHPFFTSGPTFTAPKDEISFFFELQMEVFFFVVVVVVVAVVVVVVVFFFGFWVIYVGLLRNIENIFPLPTKLCLLKQLDPTKLQVNREHTAYGWNAQSGFDGGTVMRREMRVDEYHRDERYLKSMLSCQIIPRPHTTDFPQKVAFWKGNARLFQGNLGW